MGRISYRGVSKAFGSLSVISDIDIEIEDGDFVVFVGPSGCGKSTLLRMLAGLESVTSGEIAINGHTVTDLPPKDRDIAMVFQNYALYPHLTVGENIGFPLRIQGVSAGERRRQVDETVALLGLDGLLERYPRELSGGQRQRVAMGRAIVRHPQVFLFDEPLSNLDAALRVQMRKEIKLLHTRLKTTMIFVTHDQAEAMTLADKIVVLRDGKVEQFADPLDIYHRPANSFVASFIGSPPINLIDCRLKEGLLVPNIARFQRPLGVLSEAADEIGDGADVKVGVRPEAVRLAQPGESGIAGDIAYLETNGQDTVFSVDLGSGSLTASMRSTSGLRMGDRVTVVLETPALHLFDPDGRRLQVAISTLSDS